MVRVIYKWKVDPENVPKFKSSWAKTTNTIRETVNGARGSILLKDNETDTIFITIARWDNIESWQLFWKGPAPVEMEVMHKVAERLSVESYEEIEDFTV